jgi:hypothetical protein
MERHRMELVLNEHFEGLDLYRLHDIEGKGFIKEIVEAVDLTISSMGSEEKKAIREMAEKDLIFLHLGFGESILNQCGSWAGNKELLLSCGSEDMHPDDASMNHH